MTTTTVATILIAGALVAILIDDLKPHWPKRHKRYSVTGKKIKRKIRK